MEKMLQSFWPAMLDYPVERQPVHPLHVVITVKALEEYPDMNVIIGNEGYFIASLLPDGISYSRNIFVHVHVLNIEEVSDGIFEEDVLHIYVTKEFLKHYRFTFMQKVFIKPVDCVPLTRVIFAARTQASYLWAKHRNWHDDLLLVTYQKKSLCRLHDVLLLSPVHFMLEESSLNYDLFAIACEPVNQGVMTTTTAVIILDVGDKLVRQALQSDFRFCMTANSSLLAELYINHSCSDKLRIIKDTSIPEIKLTGSPDEVISFDIEIISKFDGVFNPNIVETNTLDPLNTVFITNEILEKIKVPSGSYVKVSLGFISGDGKQIEFESSEKQRLVTVCAIDESKGRIIPNVLKAHITPHLWFNLNSHPSKLLQPECKLLMMSFRSDGGLTPVLAKEVFIALVQSPCYDGTISCDKMVENFFSLPRFLCKGDIIGISTKDAADLYERSNEGDSVIMQPVVYFRVSLIEGSPSDYGHLVLSDCAKMYQAGTVQFYIPVTMSTFYFDCVCNPSYVESPTLPGLNYYVDILEEIIEPLLNIQNNCSYSLNSNILVTGPAGCGKSLVVRAVCKRLNLHLYQVNCHELLGENSGTIEARLVDIMEKALMYAPCVLMLKNIDFIGREKELKGENSRVLSTLCDLLGRVNSPENEWPAVVIATSDSTKLMDGDMAAAFLHVVNIEPLQECERLEIIENLLQYFQTNFDVSPHYLAHRTAGFVLSDLCTLISQTTKKCHSRLKQLLKCNNCSRFEEDVSLAGFPVIRKDFLSALEVLQSDYARESGAPKIPNVSWEDVGGLTDVKQEILDTIQLPMDHPEILSAGLRRSGVLLYGPPGTGKTLLAKAVATECSLNFISIKGPELINMYVGQSEENVRAVFQQARSSAPCILFFDEVDSLAPYRGRSGDCGGVMDRVVSQLLAEIDGMSTSSDIFVIGATNRPDLIDPALLRPGRFDRLVYVGVPEDKEAKLSVLKALTRQLNLGDDVSLLDIIDSCPANLTGADFYSLCSTAMMNRIRQNVELIERGKAKLENVSTDVQKEDFKSAVENLTPSVSEEDLARHQKLKNSI